MRVKRVEKGFAIQSRIMSGPSKTQGDPSSAPNGELIVSAPVLARWLGFTGKAVYDLAKIGVLVRFRRDDFPLEKSVRRYCDHIREITQGILLTARNELVLALSFQVRKFVVTCNSIPS